jgi:hypothetical protein
MGLTGFLGDNLNILGLPSPDLEGKAMIYSPFAGDGRMEYRNPK